MVIFSLQDVNPNWDKHVYGCGGSGAVLYSAPPIPAGMHWNLQEWDWNPLESTGMGPEWNWN